MKAHKEMDPKAAFPDPKRPPAEADLPATLGKAYAPVSEIYTRLRAAHPDVTAAWQYSGKVGWYEVLLLGKRRLLYLVPKAGGFRLSIILGSKALAALKSSPLSPRIAPLLKQGQRYPEGTAFNFDPKSLQTDLLVAFLEAKIKPT